MLQRQESFHVLFTESEGSGSNYTYMVQLYFLYTTHTMGCKNAQQEGRRGDPDQNSQKIT